jgi:hypothetical protein
LKASWVNSTNKWKSLILLAMALEKHSIDLSDSWMNSSPSMSDN